MAATGFSPATRVFEAAGAGACLITDAWEGIELFLSPARRSWWRATAQDVAGHLAALTPERARAIGLTRAGTRAGPAHLCNRAAQVDAILREELAQPPARGTLHEGEAQPRHRGDRPQPLLVVGQWPCDDLSRLAEGPGGTRPCVTFLERDSPGMRRTAILPIPAGAGSPIYPRSAALRPGPGPSRRRMR